MPSQINDLPHEVLQLIFDLIDSNQYATLRSVSSVWNSMLSPHVFKSVTIYNYYRKKRTLDSILDDMEHALAEATSRKHTFGIPIGHYIQHLALLYDDTTGDQLQRIPALCPNITSFAIASKIMDNITPEPLSPHHSHYGCQHADDITQHTDQSTLGDFETRYALFIDFFTSLGGPKNKKVTKLKLGGSVSYPMLNKIILPSLSHLVALDLGSVVWESDADVAEGPLIGSFVDTIDLMDLIQDSCPHLETLSMMVDDVLKMADHDLGMTALDVLASWVSTIRVWQRLTSLHLKFNVRRHSSRHRLVLPLMYLSVRLPGLQHLQVITTASKISWDSSTYLKYERIVSLLRAGLLDSPSTTQRVIFSGLQSINLENVAIGILERMILFGYDDLLQGSAITTSLQSIELTSCGNYFQQQNDDDRTICHITNFLRYCTSQNPLTSLKINFCGLSEKQLMNCLTFGTNHLKTLELVGLDMIDIGSILDLCPHLQHLRLLECGGVYESTTTMKVATQASASATTIQDQYHPLKLLDLTGSKIKGTNVLRLVSQRCRQLSVLNLVRIILYDPETTSLATKTRKSPSQCNDTKQHYHLAERLGAHIYMPYTKLSLCSLGGGTRYQGHRFKKSILNFVFLPLAATTTTDHRSATLWHITKKPQTMPLGKYSKKVLDRMASFDDGGDFCFDDDFSGLGDQDDYFLQQMERDGLLSIQCRDIQEMVVAGQTYYGPFGTL